MDLYKWEDFNNPKIILLRRKFKLSNVISSGKSELEKQCLLKDWINRKLVSGTPTKDYSGKSAFEILKDANEGKKMWCTQFAFAFLQCGIALGWYVRKIGIDSDHKQKEEMHHGIVDIWSSQLKKWYVIDPLNNLHFEKNNIPLNVLEIREELLENGGINVKGIIGNKEKVVFYDKNSRGFNTPSNYYWFFISLRNNFMKKPGLYDTKTLLWVDKYNKNKVWYKGGGSKGKPHKHPMYKFQFIKTGDKNLCFPKM